MNSSEKFDVIKVLKTYETDNWINWISDILNLGIAYPISNISAFGDPIIDMPNFLMKNLISTEKYEKAINYFIKSTYYNNPYDFVLLDRLIETCMVLNASSSNVILFNILKSPTYINAKGVDYLKTSALLALAKSSELENELKEDIYRYVHYFGLNEMVHDPYFFSTFLRFSYIKKSSEDFFMDLSLIIEKVNSINDEKFNSIIIPLFIEKIDEFHTVMVHKFFPLLFKWLFDIHSNSYITSFKNNNQCANIVKGISELIKEGSFEIPSIPENGLIHDVIKPPFSVLLLTSIIVEEDLSQSKIFNDEEIIIYILKDILNSHPGYKDIFTGILLDHLEFLSNTSLRTIPKFTNDIEILYLVDKVFFDLNIQAQSIQQVGHQPKFEAIYKKSKLNILEFVK